MFCEKCGSKIQEGSRFCQNCGHLLEPINQIPMPPRRQGMSTGAIVGLVIGGVFVFIIAMSFIFWAVGLTAYVGNEIETEETMDKGYVDLTLDNTKLSFRLPNGYHESDGNKEDYKEYENVFGDYLIYYLDYAYDDYYKNEKIYIKKIYDTQYPNQNTLNEYSTKINGKDTMAFYIDYKEDGFTYRVTYVFYPINDDYYATIVLGIEDLTKNDLGKYIKLENMNL